MSFNTQKSERKKKIILATLCISSLLYYLNYLTKYEFVAQPQEGSYNDLLQSLDQNREYSVILMAGQSNMTGEAKTSKLDESMKTLPSNVMLFDFSSRPDLIKRTHLFGPELSLARHLGVVYPNKNFVLIKYALGGASMFNWNSNYNFELAKLSKYPTFGNMYRNYISIINKITENRTVNYEALLWMQGESDAKTKLQADQYYELFSDFIFSLRRDLNTPDLKVVLGHISPPVRFEFKNIVQRAQIKISTQLENIYVVPTADLSKKMMSYILMQ